MLRPWSAVRGSFLLLCAAIAVPAVACGDADSDSDSDSGAGTDGSASASASATAGTGPAAQNCPERCAAKAADCGAPADVASAQCQSVCGGSLTEDQLDCLEMEDCATLTEVFLGTGSACGIGGGSSSASGGSASASASGGSATGSSDADIGDACECSDPDADYESCSGTGSSCGSLTCYVVFGEGICSQSCTADASGDDCPSGECTTQVVNGLEVGTWCVP